MIYRISVLVLLSGLFAFWSPAARGADQEIKFITDPVQRLDVRFRLFKTTNIWTYLLLDTRTGRIWQAHHGVSSDSASGTHVLNDLDLLYAGQSPKDGRFTLYPTQNIYNFILLDQDDGRTWQIQWSHEEGKRGILSNMPDLDKKD